MSIQDPPRSLQSTGPYDPPALPLRTPGGLTAVILEHSESTPLGLLSDVLDAGSVDRHTVHPGSGRSLPDPTGVELAIAIDSDTPTGGAPTGSFWTEVEWLRQTHAAGASILGIGSGAETLALALGGGIERSRRPQHGWTWVQTTEPELVAPGPWLAWHDHDILLPTAAEPIAHNARGPQAFRLGRHLGIHFHPEITPEILGSWVLGPNHNGLDTQGVLEGAVRDFKTTATNAYQLLTTFIARSKEFRAHGDAPSGDDRSGD
jgi:GMP synthase-like glutamine amidotransferase